MAPPVDGPEVRAPIALNTPVTPVEGGNERVTVVLELVVDAQGHVTSARAVNGREPYASAAVQATEAWSFRPAMRDGRPVAARISFLVTYEPAIKSETPAESEQPPEDEQAPPPARAATAHAAPMTEVVVFGELPEPGGRSITRAEVNNLAGAFGDPLRAMEVMPGVTPILTGLPLFFVRGAPPGNVGFFVDGVRIPLLYHGFLGPSVLNPAFLERVTLHGGPAPVRYGRFAGGVLAADLAEPTGELHGEATVRLLDAGGFVEAPTSDGRGYALVGGRYSYTGLLVSAVSPGLRLDYWDYQALAGYHLTTRDEISVFSFGAFDFFGSEETSAGTEFHRVDVRYDRRIDPRSKLRLATTFGFDRTRSDTGLVSDLSIGGRARFVHRGDDLAVRAGGDFYLDDYALEVDPAIAEPEVFLELFPARTDATGGAYLDFVFNPEGWVRVIPGVRADVYSSLGDVVGSVDPRVAVEYDLTDTITATHSLGVAHQSPNFVPNIPGAQVGGLEQGLQQSLQAASSVEARLPWDLTGSIAVFINGTRNLSDPIGLSQSLAVDETADRNRSLGRAAGVEFFLQRPLTGRLGGLVSYTFSRAWRSFDSITTPPGYDRPHVFNAALSYDFGRNWQGSGKLAVASGIAGRRTTLDGFVFDQTRSTPFFRLDLKLAKRWYPTEHFWWGIHGEVLNATYSGSVTRRTCTVDGCEDEGTTPIIFPSVGVEAHWQ